MTSEWRPGSGWKQSSGKRTGGAILEVSNVSTDEIRMRRELLQHCYSLCCTEISAALSTIETKVMNVTWTD